MAKTSEIPQAKARVMRDALERIHEMATAPTIPAVTIEAIAALAKAALGERVKP